MTIIQTIIRDVSFYKYVFSLVLPMALQNLISVGLNMADTLMLGIVSGNALAGSALGNNVYFVFVLFIFGLSSGASVLTAQYWGKGDVKTICQVLAICLRASAAVGILFAAGAIFFPRQIISLFLSDGAVIEAGASFLRIIGFSFLFSAFTMTYLNIIRSVEIVRPTLYIYLTSFLVNITLNWLLIFGNLGAPEMGIEGAAIGTLIARGVEFTITLIYSLKINKRLPFMPSLLFRKASLLVRDFIRYSLPVMLNELLWALGVSMQLVILGHLNSSSVEAFAVVRVFQQLAMVVSMGLANAAAVVVGKTIGAKDEVMARGAANSLLLLTLVIGLATGSILFALTPVVLSFYSALSDVVLYYLRSMLMTIAVCCIFQSLNCTIIVGVMRGGGDTKFGLYIDVGALWGISLVLGSIGGFIFGWPIPFVFIALVSDEAIKLILGILRIRSGAWLSNVTREIA